ncbi:hypothetical protein FISHEDRAFT_47285, partial [Fistulina hepatica ATCC 64428]
NVGILGGFIQSGGHSPLSSIYGMAADHVLAFELVDANGRFISVTEDDHPDLFWALRGGGGSTFGVVTSVTIKAHPRIDATVTRFNLFTNENFTADLFWQSVHTHFQHFERYADAGAYQYFRLHPLGNDQFWFEMVAFFAPNMTVAEYNALTEPWYTEWADLGVPFSPVTGYYDNYYDAWTAAFPLEIGGTGAGTRIATRILPLENWECDSLLNATVAAIRNITEHGYMTYHFQLKADLLPENSENAVNPAWRNNLDFMFAITHIPLNATPDEWKDIDYRLTYDTMDQIRGLTPTSGSYLGEGDINEPDWQQAFYGSNYQRLYDLKKYYDPDDVFYATTAVGSENWEVVNADNLPIQNGKLCRLVVP